MSYKDHRITTLPDGMKIETRRTISIKQISDSDSFKFDSITITRLSDVIIESKLTIFSTLPLNINNLTIIHLKDTRDKDQNVRQKVVIRGQEADYVVEISDNLVETTLRTATFTLIEEKTHYILPELSV